MRNSDNIKILSNQQWPKRWLFDVVMVKSSMLNTVKLLRSLISTKVFLWRGWNTWPQIQHYLNMYAISSEIVHKILQKTTMLTIRAGLEVKL